jgi:hypothetical protein
MMLTLFTIWPHIVHVNRYSNLAPFVVVVDTRCTIDVEAHSSFPVIGPTEQIRLD